jgi:hypothetical protein
MFIEAVPLDLAADGLPRPQVMPAPAASGELDFEDDLSVFFLLPIRPKGLQFQVLVVQRVRQSTPTERNHLTYLDHWLSG